MRILIIAVLAGIMQLSAAVAAPPPYNMTLAGASPGGLWTLLGIGIDAAVKASYPTSSITYQTSGGGFANVGLVQAKKAQLGIVHNAELKLALEGAPPFKAPVTDLRTLVRLYDWAPMHVAVTKSFAEKHGLRTFEDIGAKKPPVRVVLNKRGNIVHGVSELMFDAIGVSLDDIVKWGGQVILAAGVEQTDLVKDRRADMLLNGIFVGTSYLRDLDHAFDLVFLPLAARTVAEVSRKAGIGTFTIKPSSYRLQPEPIPTVALGAELVVAAAMDAETAYNLTKALVENIGKIQQVHPSLAALTPQVMSAPAVLPYHAGAARYYREAGLMK